MAEAYIIGIDQSTQGTKALLFDREGTLLERCDLPHKQIINGFGWVEHNAQEFYRNTIQVVKDVVAKAGIDKDNIVGIGISNQRETALAWDMDGTPIYNAIVWQCARAEAICKRLEDNGCAEIIKNHTGLRLSPYFSAGKIAWLLENVEGARDKANNGQLRYGTVDTFLIYKLTEGNSYKTDYSNASRTQLFNLQTLSWDPEICNLFNIPIQNLPQVWDSNGKYGETDFEGFLNKPVPIHGVLGDSHGALFGQGCLERGMTKTTYGTGSSIMMNIGDKPTFSDHGLVTSLAWGMDGIVNYVFEGNINYTGAVIRWIEEDLKLVTSAKETEKLAWQANPDDKTYLVPAFTGLGAPYWDSEATGIISGITRTTGQAEIAKAALECIAYQITDVLEAMSLDAGIDITELRVDGGPTKNGYLMQFQSDIANISVQIPEVEELSGIGAAYAAGLGLGLYKKEDLFNKIQRKKYEPAMTPEIRRQKLTGWKQAINLVLTK